MTCIQNATQSRVGKKPKRSAPEIHPKRMLLLTEDEIFFIQQFCKKFDIAKGRGIENLLYVFLDEWYYQNKHRPKCHSCGKPMVRAWDPIVRSGTGYVWRFNCACASKEVRWMKG